MSPDELCEQSYLQEKSLSVLLQYPCLSQENKKYGFS